LGEKEMLKTKGRWLLMTFAYLKHGISIRQYKKYFFPKAGVDVRKGVYVWKLCPFLLAGLTIYSLK
jgi:hypothetical protein